MHTLSAYTVYFDFGKGMRGGGGEPERKKVRRAIVQNNMNDGISSL
jgi:hypothetical protein